MKDEGHLQQGDNTISCAAGIDLGVEMPWYQSNARDERSELEYRDENVNPIPSLYVSIK